MEILNGLDLRNRTLVRVVKVIDGKDLYFRNERTGQIEIVFIGGK